MGFAVVGVINAVFIQETCKVVQNDDEIMYRQGRRANRILAEKMRRLMATADTSGDEKLDREEFREMFQNTELKIWLASLEFKPKDVDALFDMMDGGSGSLSVDDMIKGVAMYKGNARNIDLHTLIHRQKYLHGV